MSNGYRLILEDRKWSTDYPQFKVQGGGDVIAQIANTIIKDIWVMSGVWGPSQPTPDQIVLDILAADFNERLAPAVTQEDKG